MDDVLIQLDDVSKKFCRTLKQSMLYGMQDVFADISGVQQRKEGLRSGEFWALEDVSFQLKRGECLGLIGANGAGKSTLLKILGGIIPPDRGRVVRKGKLGALIELGAGFHPLLTGRENIFVYGSILGMSRDEIKQQFDSIVGFSGLSQFLDTPVKHYSSGMLVRLGFSVAVHLSPDVLLIDEVLAVGDASFRAKCYDAIFSKLKECAVIFVSHNMTHVSRICSEVMLLDNGKSENFQDTASGIEKYLDLAFSDSEAGKLEFAKEGFEINNIVVSSQGPSGKVVAGEPCRFSFEMNVGRPLEKFTVILSILSQDHTPIAYDKRTFQRSEHASDMEQISLQCSSLVAAPGNYSLAIAVFDDVILDQILWYHNVSSFSVNGDQDFVGVPIRLLGEWNSQVSSEAPCEGH